MYFELGGLKFLLVGIVMLYNGLSNGVESSRAGGGCVVLIVRQ